MKHQTFRKIALLCIAAALVIALVAICIFKYARTPQTVADGFQTKATATTKPRQPDSQASDYWDSPDAIESIRKDLDKSLAASLVTAAFPMQQRIYKQISLLKSESVQDSVRMLSEVEMFYWPGHGMDGMMVVIMPLRGEIGQHDIESIMSNRRFLKVFQELSSLSKAEASDMVIRELRDTMPVYKGLYEKQVEALIQGRKNAPKGANMSAGLSLQINNNSDHAPTLAGARFKLLSLILLAGNLNLEAARPTIREIAEFACQQRNGLYAPHEVLTSSDRFCVLCDGTLYNRQIIACGLQQQTASAGDTWQERTLTRFDARATPYDLLSRGGGPIKPDYSKGSIKVAFPQPIDDATVDGLVKGK